MAQYEPQMSVGGLLALGKVRQNSNRIVLGKINILVARQKGICDERREVKQKELRRKKSCEGREAVTKEET